LRVFVPDINRLLPVYVFDHYEGFRVKTIPEMTVDECETHIEMTAAVLRSVVAQGCSHLLANHALFGPMELLSDQAICLYFMNKSAKNGRFLVLGNTFQGQKQGCKEFGIP